MQLRKLLLGAALLALTALFPAETISAAPVTYHVDVNTSALAGQAGAVFLQFNPGGPAALAATATVANFAVVGPPPGSGLTGALMTNGGVFGTLSPGPLTMTNSTGFNAAQQGINYGSDLNFDVTFSGPALNGSSNTGSSFALTLLNGANQPQLTTDPNGTVVTINVNGDGSTTPLTFPTPGGGPPAATVTPLAGPATVPEPTSVALLGLGLAGVGAYTRYRRHRAAR